MDLSKLLAKRVEQVPLGKQTSVAIPGLINMGSGTPDFVPPDFIFDAMREAVDEKQIKYTPWAGTQRLREAAATKLARENDLTMDPNGEIIVTSGAQEALVSVLMGILDPGDNALIPSPHYVTYQEVARMIGAELIPVPTTLESNFTIDPEALAAAITPRTKLIIMVTPSNPTGTVTPEATLRAVAELAIERDLLVIADEIYEHYVFDGHEHVSMATLPGMRERTITLNSLSKGYALTGLRVGYIAAPENLLDAFMPFHHAMTICASTIAQAGAAAALERPRDWFAPHLEEYGRRRGLWMKKLDDLGIRYAEPQGAYYVAIDTSGSGMSAAAFGKRLRDESKVVLGRAGENVLRGSLMQASPQFEEGLERFTAFVRGL